MPFINTTAKEGTYAHIVGTKDIDITVAKLMEYVVYPMAKKLDEDMAELRAEIAKLSAKPNGGDGSARKQRKTRKSRK